MECKDCRHSSIHIYDKYTVCDISHWVSIKGCSLESDDVSEYPICYNCKYWIGGGDWGLSCMKDYYMTTSNGFSEACEKFERKEYDKE